MSKTSIAKCAFLFFVAFVVFYAIYGKIQIWNGPMFGFGFAIDDRILAVLFSSLVAVYVVVAYAVIVLRCSLSLRACRVAGASYILILFLVLFGKSIGVSGINLDLFQPDAVSMGTLLNLLVFVPIGFFLQLRTRETKKTIFGGLCLVVGIEAAQCVLRLGIADVIDVIANLSGIVVGVFLCSILNRSGWAFSEKDKRVKLVRNTKSELAIWQKVILIMGCGFLVCSVLTLLPFGDIYDQETELLDSETIPFLEIDSDVLRDLSAMKSIPQESLPTQKQVPDFEFGNEISSADWMATRKGGVYASEGTVDQVVAWRNKRGQNCLGLTVCCRELIDGIVVIHGLPIVATEDTAIVVDGAPAEIEELRSRAYDLLTCYISCEFCIEDGWLFAREISIATTVDNLPDDIALFNYYKYDDYLKASENDKPFLRMADEQLQEIWGHLVSITGRADGSTYCTVQFYDKLGSAPIVHSVNIECPAEAPSYPEQADDLSRLTIVKEGNELILVN